MKKAIFAGLSALLTGYLTDLIFGLFGFHYSVLKDGFELLSFSIDFGSYIVIFLLIFSLFNLLFAREER